MQINNNWTIGQIKRKTDQDCVDTVDFGLVLEESKVSHVAHDAREALKRHLVQVGRLQSQKRVLKIMLNK